MGRTCMETRTCLTVSLAVNGQALLAVQLTQQVAWAGGRRELRALRSEAMAALARAWRCQACRDQWRAGKP